MPNYGDNPLDQEVNTEFMRVCKCVIPYLDRGIQKNVAIGLKFLELVNTINTFSETATLSSNLSLTRQGHWEQDLLRNVRTNLSPEKAYIIDALIKLQEFRSILNIHPQSSPQQQSHPPASAPMSTSSTDPPNFFTPPPSPEDSPPAFEPFEPFSTPDSFPPSSQDMEQNKASNLPPPRATSQLNSGPSPASMIQMLSPLLDDNQKQMLNLFTSLLGNNQ